MHLKARILPGTFEADFVTEMVKILNKAEQDRINNITDFVVENYAEQVGGIRAIREIQSQFSELVTTFFPE